MGYGLYDGIVDTLLDFLGLSDSIQDSLRSTLIDSLEMTTILLFLFVNTIMLIWLERKAWPRMMNMRGITFVDFNYGHFFGRTWKFGFLQNIAEFLKFFSNCLTHRRFILRSPKPCLTSWRVRASSDRAAQGPKP